ncbi:hypothetical protein CP965_01520 [Halarcobacter mediterraneus]|uniref:Redoxin domain-containing protein n=1 Tax=Halarcobacter mediterraneus TaxID=2023153 RepID=A0A4Q1AXT2_9BACT|nr:hypothetical protein [Halarcobacter mediterraneus]RXK14153.1 hypothetical protein CP965_01520 [Halarcobacter mediterraneus]
MANLLKVVFLGLFGFALLVYFTAEKPKQIVADDNVVNIVKYNALPNLFELVGKDDKVKKEDLLKEGEKTLIVVGNHDSLSVVKELPKYFDLKIPYVMVANISSAPWFVKKMFIPGKLEDLNEDSNIPMIYDFDGDMVNTLHVIDNAKTKFVAFLLSEDGVISKLYEGNVKEGALDGSMNEEEKKKVLSPLYNLL